MPNDPGIAESTWDKEPLAAACLAGEIGVLLGGTRWIMPTEEAVRLAEQIIGIAAKENARALRIAGAIAHSDLTAAYLEDLRK